jgi:predicted helicase
MTEANTARVERQKQAPITVIIGNPPYNSKQLDENDNNKNRSYAEVDKKIRDTYGKESKATLNAKLYDPYVKFFRWATDRLGKRDGIVCFVTNNSFVDQVAFDGMRKCLEREFTSIYHLDLHGNVRHNARLSGTTHNVFGIQIGVGITLAIRLSEHKNSRLYYYRVPELAAKGEKLAFLADNVESDGTTNALNTIHWSELVPDKNHNWLMPEHSAEFSEFIAIASKDVRGSAGSGAGVIFKTYALGINSARDQVVYDYSSSKLRETIKGSSPKVSVKTGWRDMAQTA